MKIPSKLKKGVALFLLINILNQVLAPDIVYALTAGPTAPEATNFEPIDTTDMVNPLTGSFTYSIPLLEVPGPEGSYPLALSYHAGIQPNEEASWVGLGWSLNPGAIARNVNGYPDDWNGDAGTTSNNWSGGQTYSYSASINVGIGGVASVDFGLQASSDTYQGFGVGEYVGVSYLSDLQSLTQASGLKASLGVQVGISPYGNLYDSFNIGYGYYNSSANGLMESVNVGIQTNFQTASAGLHVGISADSKTSLIGASIASSGGISVSSNGVSEESTSAVDKDAGKISSSKSGFSFTTPTMPVSITLGYSHTRYWSSTSSNFTANGVLYNRSSNADLTSTDDDNYSLLNSNIEQNPDPLLVMGGTFPNFDDYSVTAQGLGGNMRPYIFQSVLYNENRVNSNDDSDDVYGENFPTSTNSANTPMTLGKPWQFRFIGDMSNSFRQGHPWNGNTAYSFDGNPQYGNNDGDYGYDPTSNRLEGSSHIEYFTNQQITNGYAAGRGFVDCNDIAGFDRSTIPQDQIGGFMITNSSGVTYHYALPVYSRGEIMYTQSNSGNSANATSSNKVNRPAMYAYTWYLTAITGPDYVDRGYAGLDSSDWGYWVKFVYGKWTDNYAWRNPAIGYNTDLDNQFQNYSSGVKQLYYLDAIQTRTHTAIFEKEIRADGHDATGINQFTYPSCQGGNITASTLRLNNIYLFQNDQLPLTIDQIRSSGTNYDQTITVSGNGCNNTIRPVNGDWIIDKYDINNSWANKCLRKIALNYDYSLSPGCPNSYDPGGNNTYFTTATANANSPSPETTLNGRLTLLSVDFQGKGGTPVTPPMRFQYDLDPTDPKNNGLAASIKGYNPKGIITFSAQTASNFAVGDMITFTLNNNTYYATLLSTTDNISYNALWVGAIVPDCGNISVTKTKNPPFNYDAFDTWQCYKSDYVADASNVNLSRITTAISSKSADAWSLHNIKSSIGANIKIEYEGNTYKNSVLNQNPSIIIGGNGSSNTLSANGFQTTGNINSDGTIDVIAYNPQNIDLTKIFPVNSRISGPLVFYWSLKNSGDGQAYKVINLNGYPNTFITSVNNVTNDIKISLDSRILAAISPQIGFEQLSVRTFVTGNLIPKGAINFYYGGGIRIKDIQVDDLNGNVKQTCYTYCPFGMSDQNVSSGVTSYLPTTLDADNLSAAINTNYIKPTDTANVFKDFRTILYNNDSKLLNYARFAPAPGVMYETVSVNDYNITSSGAVPIDGTTVYQYEVFKPEMLGIDEYFFEDYGQPSNNVASNGLMINDIRAHDVSVKDYTSRVGNVKSITTYDNNNNVLTQKINHYLYDDLDNTSLQNQINNYEPRLQSGYGQATYNYQGEILERYATARCVASGGVINEKTNPSMNIYQEKLVMSNKETFPSFQTGSTQIDYKNGTTVSQQNLSYDYYSGVITKTLTIDAYGNRFIDIVTPAYTAGGGTTSSTLVYPALGLKTHDDQPGAVQHKQMLTQQAASYTFSVNSQNSNIGVIKATAQTWASNIPVLDQDGNNSTSSGNSIASLESNIWRMAASYSWLAAPNSISNNTTQNASQFVDFFANNGNSNPSWKRTGNITQYNVYSDALEATDINNNYTATRMGYNNSKVLITGTGTRYNEIAYAGAEDALLSNNNFSNNISPGSGTIVTDSTKAHTGTNSLMVPANSSGFTYSVPISQLNPNPQNYSVSVWVYSPTSNVASTNLYYTGSGGTVTPAQTYAKVAKNWYLLEMTVPASAIPSSGNLIVGCQNGSSSTVYFDDFRFQPTNSQSTAYVYDNQTGELTYTIDNNNLYTRYQYDAIGRLVRVYKEVFGKTTTPILKSIAYNYGASMNPLWQNTGFSSQCQTVNGRNTGYMEIQQIDSNPFSVTYGNTRWVTGTDPAACSVPIYARLSNTSSENNNVVTGTYTVSFYADAQGTVPYILVQDLSLNFQAQQTLTSSSGSTQTVNYNYSVLASGGSSSFTINNPIVLHECNINSFNPFDESPSPGSYCIGNNIVLNASGYTLIN